MPAASPLATARSSIRLVAADAELRCELARWALANGHSLNIDAATVLLAARRALAARGRRHLVGHRWTEADVRQVSRTVVPQLWRLHGLGAAPALGDSMRTYLRFLWSTDRMSGRDTPLPALLDATIDADTGGVGTAPGAVAGAERSGQVGLAPVVRLAGAGRQVRPK